MNWWIGIAAFIAVVAVVAYFVNNDDAEYVEAIISITDDLNEVGSRYATALESLDIKNVDSVRDQQSALRTISADYNSLLIRHRQLEPPSSLRTWHALREEYLINRIAGTGLRTDAVGILRADEAAIDDFIQKWDEAAQFTARGDSLSKSASSEIDRVQTAEANR